MLRLNTITDVLSFFHKSLRIGDPSFEYLLICMKAGKPHLITDDKSEAVIEAPDLLDNVCKALELDEHTMRRMQGDGIDLCIGDAISQLNGAYPGCNDFDAELTALWRGIDLRAGIFRGEYGDGITVMIDITLDNIITYVDGSSDCSFYPVSPETANKLYDELQCESCNVDHLGSYMRKRKLMLLAE
jgi:hypothetical protein